VLHPPASDRGMADAFAGRACNTVGVADGDLFAGPVTGRQVSSHTNGATATEALDAIYVELVDNRRAESISMIQRTEWRLRAGSRRTCEGLLDPIWAESSDLLLDLSLDDGLVEDLALARVV